MIGSTLLAGQKQTEIKEHTRPTTASLIYAEADGRNGNWQVDDVPPPVSFSSNASSFPHHATNTTVALQLPAGICEIEATSEQAFFERKVNVSE